MKIEDPFTYIEKLIERDDGFTEKLTQAKALVLRGKIDEAIPIVQTLPLAVLCLGVHVSDPATGGLIPDKSVLPDFIKTKKKVEPAAAVADPKEKVK